MGADEIIENLRNQKEKFKISLKCIREILDGFSIGGAYTIKQYQDSIQRINEVLEKHDI